MSNQFDPYYKWLAIPSDEQPPDNYRLLGLRRFEGDADVIAGAADQRMAHLRNFQNGKHSALCQRLLNEVSAARLCLLREDRKTEYDAQLRGATRSSSTSSTMVGAAPGAASSNSAAMAAASATSGPLIANGGGSDPLLEYLGSCGLVSKADWQNLSQTLHPVTGEGLANALLQARKLTPYQVQQIRAGRSQSLILGNYVVLDILGQGGMGRVLKAWHKRMKRVVALKMISPGLVNSPVAVERFEREVETAAQLDHLNIVTAYDADEAGGAHFLAMQYVPGVDLGALVGKRRKLPVSHALSCVLQAARGLEYAHSKGVIHRDIKPSNLLLDKNGVVKILDMGLAQLESNADQGRLTGSNQIVGTVDFLAPEHCNGSSTYDARSDIYALGATLWHLLTGSPMYEGSVSQKLLAHQNAPVPELRPVCPEAPTQLEAVFDKMVAKDPAQRYQSMSEVIADLEQAAAAASLAEATDGRLNTYALWLERNATASPSTMDTAPDEPAVTLTEWQPAVAPAKSSVRLGLPWIGLIAVGVVIFLAATLGSLLMIRTKKGVVRIEINDPTIEIVIKGTDIVLKGADQEKDITLAPGEHQLLVRRGDFAFETSNFVLKRGENISLRVDLLPGEIEVRQGEKVIGEQRLPSASGLASGRNQPPAAVPPAAIPPAKVPPAAGPSELAKLPLDSPLSPPVTPAEAPAILPPPEAKWDGWAKDAPPPANVPFSAAQAKAHQQAWADYYKTEIEKVTELPDGQTLKMVFIPPGEFVLGDQRAKAATLTEPFWIATTEITQAQWHAVFATQPWERNRNAEVGDQLPAGHISWDDARAFCSELTRRERAFGRLPNDWKYDLPSEAQWEFACRAGTDTLYSFGDDPAAINDYAWWTQNADGKAHPVALKKPNAFGLYDMHGNVREWCRDTWAEIAGGIDPEITEPAPDASRVTRGWDFALDHIDMLRSGRREKNYQVSSRISNGLRPVLMRVPASEPEPPTGGREWPAGAPARASTPFDAAQARQFQQAWADYLKLPVEQTVALPGGAKATFELIPPGDFRMGGSIRERRLFGAAGQRAEQYPWRRVWLTKPFYLCTAELTQAQWTAAMGGNPSRTPDPTHPVDTINEEQYLAFLAKANQAAPAGMKFALPTEAQWEFAARAGTQTAWHFGDDERQLGQYAWTQASLEGVAEKSSQPVGKLKPNAFGLFDMYGNVAEWCSDRFKADYYLQGPLTDPEGMPSGDYRTRRGGSWVQHPHESRSAWRHGELATKSRHDTGIRLALTLDE